MPTAEITWPPTKRWRSLGINKSYPWCAVIRRISHDDLELKGNGASSIERETKWYRHIYPRPFASAKHDMRPQRCPQEVPVWGCLFLHAKPLWEAHCIKPIELGVE
jgi:hypothetical protein